MIKIQKFVKYPISVGMEPVSLFKCNPKYCKLIHWDKDDGIVRDRLFEKRYK